MEHRSLLGQSLVHGGVQGLRRRVAPDLELLVLEVPPMGFMVPNLMHGLSVDRHNRGSYSAADGAMPTVSMAETIAPVGLTRHSQCAAMRAR